MTHWIPAIFALLVAAAGWFYMFYSRGASNLQGVEDPRLNARRQRLRRLCGLLLFMLAICFFALNYTLSGNNAQGFLIVMLLVFVLLVAVMALVWIDMRLTIRLRESMRQRRSARRGKRKEQEHTDDDDRAP